MATTERADLLRIRPVSFGFITHQGKCGYEALDGEARVSPFRRCSRIHTRATVVGPTPLSWASSRKRAEVSPSRRMATGSRLRLRRGRLGLAALFSDGSSSGPVMGGPPPRLSAPMLCHLGKGCGFGAPSLPRQVPSPQGARESHGWEDAHRPGTPRHDQ